MTQLSHAWMRIHLPPSESIVVDDQVGDAHQMRMNECSRWTPPRSHQRGTDCLRPMLLIAGCHPVICGWPHRRSSHIHTTPSDDWFDSLSGA